MRRRRHDGSLGTALRVGRVTGNGRRLFVARAPVVATYHQHHPRLVGLGDLQALGLDPGQRLGQLAQEGGLAVLGEQPVQPRHDLPHVGIAGYVQRVLDLDLGLGQAGAAGQFGQPGLHLGLGQASAGDRWNPGAHFRQPGFGLRGPLGPVLLRLHAGKAGLQLHVAAVARGQHLPPVAHRQQQMNAQEGQRGHAGQAQAPVGPPFVAGSLPLGADHGLASPLGNLKFSSMPLPSGVALTSARSGWPA